MRLHVVLRGAETVFVHDPEVDLREGDSLVRRQPKSPHRFDVVLREALAVGVDELEVVLRVGVALVGCAP